MRYDKLPVDYVVFDLETTGISWKGEFKKYEDLVEKIKKNINFILLIAAGLISHIQRINSPIVSGPISLE